VETTSNDDDIRPFRLDTADEGIAELLRRVAATQWTGHRSLPGHAAGKAIGELPSDAFTSPDRVATAVLTVVDVDRPPRRLVTGSTAVKEIHAALQARPDELDAWAATAKAVDGGPAG
jgi:hypothetical protein